MMRSHDACACSSKKAATALCGVLATSLLAVSPTGESQETSEIPDLSWGFLRIDTAASHSFGALTSGFAPAQLVDGFSLPAAGRPEVDVDNLRREDGALVVTDGNCDGPPGFEPNSAGFWYAQTDEEVLIISESAAPTRNTAILRRIYTDGRPHPDPARWVPTSTGHSIGWYENGDLVAETVGMTPGRVPAGGYRTPETRVMERFHLSSDGQYMTITYTWEDPKIYATPHSYSINFERVPDDSFAFEDWCDSGDPASRYGIRVPEQG